MVYNGTPKLIRAQTATPQARARAAHPAMQAVGATTKTAAAVAMAVKVVKAAAGMMHLSPSPLAIAADMAATERAAQVIT